MFLDSEFLLGKNLRRLRIENRRQEGMLKLRELFLVPQIPQIFTDSIFYFFTLLPFKVPHGSHGSHGFFTFLPFYFFTFKRCIKC